MGSTSADSTLVDLLRRRSTEQGSALAYRFLETGEVDGPASNLTYRELERRARSLAALLEERGVRGERALLPVRQITP